MDRTSIRMVTQWRVCFSAETLAHLCAAFVTASNSNLLVMSTLWTPLHHWPLTTTLCLRIALSLDDIYRRTKYYTCVSICMSIYQFAISGLTTKSGSGQFAIRLMHFHETCTIFSVCTLSKRHIFDCLKSQEKAPLYVPFYYSYSPLTAWGDRAQMSVHIQAAATAASYFGCYWLGELHSCCYPIRLVKTWSGSKLGSDVILHKNIDRSMRFGLVKTWRLAWSCFRLQKEGRRRKLVRDAQKWKGHPLMSPNPS